MTMSYRHLFVGLSLAAGALSTPVAQAGVNVNVNVGVPVPPPPVIVAPAPPRVVVVPGSPVYYAPDGNVNLFLYGGRYYTFHEGHWFMGPKHNGPWTFVSVDHVPAPVVAVPARYYRVAPAPVGGPPHCPPGQAKKGRC
jgi:YXWGXW repeat-containing protein